MKSSGNSFNFPQKFHDGFLFPDLTIPDIINLADGTAAVPSLTFTDDTDTGLYRIGANDLGITAGGTQIVSINNTRVESKEPFYAPSGAISAPGYSFTADPTTGFFQGGGNNLTLTAAGTNLMLYSTVRVGALVPFRFFGGSAAAPQFGFLEEPGTGFFRGGSQTLGFSINGTEKGRFTTSGFNVIDGTAAAPSLTFTGDTDTGLYNPTINTIGFTTAGTEISRFTNTQILASINGNGSTPVYSFVNYPAQGLFTTAAGMGIANTGANMSVTPTDTRCVKPFLISTGTALAPSLGFTIDTDTGLYFPANDTIGITCGGTETMRISITSTSINNAFVLSGLTTSTGAGAVGITEARHQINTTGTGDALTLANGTDGQILYIFYGTETAGGDTAILMPTTTLGYTMITFNNLGDSVTLLYRTGLGWIIHGSFGSVIA